MKFHAYKGIYLFIILPYFIFVIVFALSKNLKVAEKITIIPTLYAIWIIISLLNAVREKYNNYYNNNSKEELTALLLGIIPWIGLPIIAYFRMGQAIEVLITNLGFLLLFAFYVKRNIAQLRAEHEKIKESEHLLRNWNTDLQEQVKRRTKELEVMNEQRMNNFINLVHETKTPLTLVKNYLDEYIDKHGSKEELDIIKGGIDKLSDDIVNLFDIERFIKGIDVYHHDQVTDFSTILKNGLPLFEHYCIKQNIRMFKYIKDNAYIKADPNAINRIINNIIENSIKYTHPEGEIKVSLSSANAKVVFTVEDTGIGIGKKKQNKIFEPYYQINHKTKSFEGMGLGLPIVKRVVNDLGGTIEIDSDPSKSPGTKVSIRLDRYRLKEEETLRSPCQSSSKITYDLINYDDQEDSYESRRQSILLIEDNKAMNHFLSRKLSAQYNVFCTLNGSDGLKKLHALSIIPDLILLDIMMDKMDGFQFAKIISEQDRYSHIPIIFLTAKTTPADRLKGLRLGAIDFISKPFSYEALVQKIEAVLANITKQHKAILQTVISQFHTLNDLPSISSPTPFSTFDQNCKLFRLTSREIEIAKLIDKGVKYKEIAKMLFIAEKTVTKHIQNIFEKTEVSSKVELINKLSH